MLCDKVLASILGVQGGLSMGKSHCMHEAMCTEEIGMCIKEIVWPLQKQNTEN